MSATKFKSLSELKPGMYDHKIRVRVIKYWRGVTRTGEQFTNFNLILIDNKMNRIHAFAPTGCADALQHRFTLGNVCTIKNFSIQKYKPTEKFRCLRNESQLVFSKDSEIKDVDDDGIKIPHEMFDLQDHSELEDLSKQTTFLADIVGIVKKHNKLRDFTNKHGNNQTQAKFIITDGRSDVQVTFWDAFGEMFEKAYAESTERPVIIIISSCRVGVWDGKVDISNVPATQIYLNHQHHSVQHLRKLLAKPEFAKSIVAKERKKDIELLSVEAIKLLGNEFIEETVLTHLTIDHVDVSRIWYFTSCTNCGLQSDYKDNNYICSNCNRKLPHPDKKFKVVVHASDRTGAMQILLEDREIRTLIGKRAREFIDKSGDENILPACLKGLENKPYTIMIKINETNVVNKIDLYWATNICNKFVCSQQQTGQTSNQTEHSTSQATSSAQVQGISDMTFDSN